MRGKKLNREMLNYWKKRDKEMADMKKKKEKIEMLQKKKIEEENIELKSKIGSWTEYEQIIGKSKHMLEIFVLIEKALAIN